MLALGVSLMSVAAGSAQAQTAGGKAPLPDPAPGQSSADISAAAATPPGVEGTSTTTGPAAAGSPATPVQSGGLEDIVVTAQRRSERLQDVPIAVTAITASQLSRVGVSDVIDLKVAVPTLNVVNSAGYLNSSLRGIGSNGIGAGIENPIALYIDGVYYAAPAASLLSLNNVSQIEVLKGPQGTLFGRNATGGLIQITTKEPSAKNTANFNFSYANYDTYSGNAYVSGAVTDNLFMDLAFAGTFQRDGWGTNRFNGKDVYKVDHDVAGRAKMIFEPVGGTKFTLIGDYSDHRDSVAAYRVFRNTVSGFTPALGPVPDIGYDTDTDVQPLTDTWAAGGSLRWDQDIGSLSFMSLTAYRGSRAQFKFDYDGSNRAIQSIDEIQRDRQFSQELQLSSGSGGRFSWLLGGFYFNARAELDPFILTANDLGARVTINNAQRTKSIAGYAQATYEIFDKTNLTLGGRYTSEKREAYDGTTDVFVIPLGISAPTAIAPDRDRTFNKFTYRVSLDHRFSDEVLTYASYNRGFKSGGFNTSAPGSDPFRPETLDAYEVGIKTDLFGNDVRLNVAGFYYDYNDVQVQLLNQGAITIINGAKARDYGIDADLNWQVSQELRLSGGLGWISPKFRSFPNCPISTATGGTASGLGSCAGNQLPLASKFTGNVGADYSVDIGPGKLGINGNFYYNSGFYPESDNVIKQSSYILLNAGINYTLESGLSFGVFGKNLFDERIINFETTIPNGTHTGFYQAPRTYGVTIGYKY